jgi:glycosyltransferase involved in cell wall biosynthesis
LGGKVIGLAHMLPGQDMRRKYHLPFDKLEARFLSRYQNLVATTEEYAAKLRSFNPHARVNTIPNGIEAVKETRETPKHLLFLGRIEVDQKGLDLLIAAYRQTNPRLTADFPLLIAGSGTKPEQAKLLALIGNGPNIHWLGRVQGDKKHRLLRQARAVIISSRFETYSLVAQEALALGIPLITFDLRGLKWIPRNARLIASEKSAGSLSQALEKLLVADRTRLKRQITRGLEVVQGQTWSRVTSQYRALIHQLFANAN